MGWEHTVQRKLDERASLIPAEWTIQATAAANVLDVPGMSGILSALELEITETPAPAIVDAIIKHTWTSEQVTLAFCKRAAVAQQLTNCLTEILFEQALALAREIDSDYARTGVALGPLHGLPVSLKDTFRVRGKDTTIGFVAFAMAPEPDNGESESEVVRIVRQLGGVLFCKTNVPTGMMMAESYNNIWGYTTNPYRSTLSSGGSSGGEAALLAMHGIPAAFTSLYSLKPSYGRFPTLGSRAGLQGQEAVRGVNGPMSSSLESVELFARAVVGTEPWKSDPGCIPIPWRSVELPKKLCFGLVLDNGVIRPTPPVERALAAVKTALEAAGHRCIVYTPYQSARAMKLIEGLFAGDGGAHFADTLAAGGEPWPRGLELFKEAVQTASSKPALASDLWRLQAARTSYAKEALDDWLATANLTGTGREIDALISPVSPWPAASQYEFGRDVSYTCIWNLLDQPASTIPVTFVAPTDQRPDHTPRNEREQHVWDRYNAEAFTGAPVGLQLVGQRLEEEKVLALTRVVVNALAAEQASAAH
ncbi:hypothetical protein Q5752_003262 [Cryptotrichosporon argae]